MKINVKVKLFSNEEKIEKINKNNFIIKVKDSPVGGKANRSVIKILSNYYLLPVSNIKLISGNHFKNKIFKIIKNND